MIFVALESSKVIASVVDLVISETESDCRRVLVSYASAVTLRIVKAVGVKVSLLVTEVAAPLIVPLLGGIDKEELRCAVVPRHILRDRGNGSRINAEVVRIAYTSKGVVLLHVLKTDTRELQEILTEVKSYPPSLRAVFCNIANLFLIITKINDIASKILPIVSSLEGNCRCEIIRCVGAVRLDIHVSIGPCGVAIFNYPVAINSSKELFIWLPEQVKSIVHIASIEFTININIKIFYRRAYRVTITSVTANNGCGCKIVPSFRELEAVYAIVTEDSIVVDVETVVAFKVEEETSYTIANAVGKHCVDINLTDIESINVTVAALTTGGFRTGAELGVEARRFTDLLLKGQTDTVFLEVGVKSALGIRTTGLISTGEVGVKPELSGEFPSAEVLFKNGNALVDFVDLHAEGVEFVFEFHDELLEEFEVLLAGLFSVYRYEGARYYRGHLITGRGLCTFECAIRIS